MLAMIVSLPLILPSAVAMSVLVKRGISVKLSFLFIKMAARGRLVDLEGQNRQAFLLAYS